MLVPDNVVTVTLNNPRTGHSERWTVNSHARDIANAMARFARAQYILPSEVEISMRRPDGMSYQRPKSNSAPNADIT